MNDSDPKQQKGLAKLPTIIICLLIIGIAIAATNALKHSGSRHKNRKTLEKTTYVDIMTAKLSEQIVTINASGTVVPARELLVKSRVSGEIVKMHPNLIEGGIIARGTEIICIDPDDYKLAMIEAQKQVAQAKYALQVELGHQDIARQEWSMMRQNKKYQSSVDRALIFRKPHLAKAKADLAAAEAALTKTKLMLERTKIVAPFNAFVRSKHIEIGSQISIQDILVELVGIDTYWIRVSVPLDRLIYLTIPDQLSNTGTLAKIIYRNQFLVEGQIIKCLGELENQAHMAQLIVAVNNPISLSPPLIIGEYVSLRLIGKKLNNACRIPRTALRNNDYVWLVSPEKKLHIQPVVVGFRDTKDVLITKGIAHNDQIIISEIPAPVQGIPLQLSDQGD
ncbi:MAG: Secretion protein HlyD [Candidatus Magnetoglobus multicellularis str. Araruama]|uniref:Secretion protein HlyD n=1 Tax=Candidatus Magnetoglobus multicellularis str. Araruama TaxID=890399 RepID=A0A1V1PBP6_9BACT|nr:MAG: Secretion protein HlyD [Candidatus Magnetoglobus multicellularis str. Araruama]